MRGPHTREPSLSAEQGLAFQNLFTVKGPSGLVFAQAEAGSTKILKAQHQRKGVQCASFCVCAGALSWVCAVRMPILR